MVRSESRPITCDSCGKEVEKALITMKVEDKPDVQHSFGKYYKMKQNVNGWITWRICYECYLDALLSPTSKFKPSG